MEIDNKHPNESSDSNSFSSESMVSDELIVDLDGFEGPLDLLLSLSRTQRLDLMKISILQLAGLEKTPLFRPILQRKTPIFRLIL